MAVKERMDGWHHDLQNKPERLKHTKWQHAHGGRTEEKEIELENRWPTADLQLKALNSSTNAPRMDLDERDEWPCWHCGRKIDWEMAEKDDSEVQGRDDEFCSRACYNGDKAARLRGN